MEYRSYQHIERYGTDEVDGIEIGECFVFPKIDGTNASVWMDDGEVCAGSRKRKLSFAKDNAGFYNWVAVQENIRKYLKDYPTHRLFGEWLVPHSLKTYRDSAWRQFYVFDIIEEYQDADGMECERYIPYNEYKENMTFYGIEYIPAMSIITNGDHEMFLNKLKANTYLIEDGAGEGEGIVIKNYNYKNKYGRTTWAKIVTTIFKEKHTKEMGTSKLSGSLTVEEKIAENFLTTEMIQKAYEKIRVENGGGWNSRDIPKLLNTIFHDLVQEETWNIIKKYKNPKIDFKTLSMFTTMKIKTELPDLF